MKLAIKHELGETVWYVNDTDELPRIVTGYIVRPTSIIYMVSYAGNETTAYDFELTNTNPLFTNN